nr:ribonuclease H-like domain, reverse transcriptase, RNA-dependent DNA polymerase [Tanacetum cinerariifolium]
MQQFYNQQVWKLVPLPDGKIAIGTKWILKNKKDARGIVVRNKARLVAQGHRQEEGIDYDESCQSFVWTSSSTTGLVCQIVYLSVKASLQKRYIDKTLFLKKDSRHIILVQVYVDDIIFSSTNKAWCDEFEVLMKGEFEISAMGELTFFLGLQVKQLPDGIFISQDKYVKDMLKKFDMESMRIATTPYEVPKPKSNDEPDDAVNVYLFRSMIGSLMYLKASSQISCLHESDYAKSHGDRKSTIDGCQFLGRRLISWQCKKQTVVATSFTEAEYVTAASCCGQVYVYILTHSCRFSLVYFWMNVVSCGFLLYVFQLVSMPPMLLVVSVFLLVVLVHADEWVPTGGCVIPTGRYSFMLMDGFLLVVAFMVVKIMNR